MDKEGQGGPLALRRLNVSRFSPISEVYAEDDNSEFCVGIGANPNYGVDDGA
jgi:hypothetical protein